MAQVNPKKLKRTIILYFAVSSIFIGLIGFGGAAYNFYWQIRDMVLEKLEQTATARAEAISEWLRLAVMAGTQPSRHSWGKQVLEQYYAGGASREELEEVSLKVIEGAVSYSSDIRGLVRMDRNGRPLVSLGQEIPSSFWPPFTIGQREPMVNFFNLSEEQPMLLVSTPILSRTGDNLGTDIMILDTGPIQRLVSSGDNFGFDARTYMTAVEDNSYMLIFSTAPNHGWLLPAEIRNVLYESRDQNKKIISGQGITYGIGQVGNADWQVVIAVEDQKLYEPVTAQMKRTTGIFLIFFSIALVGLWFLALKPLTGEVGKTTEALEEEVEETAEKLLKASEDRKKTESKLVVATHRAIVARQAKSQFLANLSHEIRTPMNAVIGMTDLALFTNLTDEQRGYLDEVKKSADVLLGQINTLLDLSKLEDGLMVIESRDFDLAALLAQLDKSYGILSRDRGLEFNCRLDQSINPWLRGDYLRLKQILNFLLENAFKFTSRGRVELNVEQAGDPGKLDDDLIRFEVKDTGLGIEAERLPDIFDPFVQADGSLTRASGGTGMGLAVSKRLVELMGGIISVESTLGEGSVFSFTVKLPPAARKRAEGQSEPAESLKAEDFRGLQAVIVDENEVNRTVLAGYMDFWGIKAHTFENGLNALDFLNTRTDIEADIFFIDSQTPGLGPEEAEGRLSGRHTLTPVIFMTSDISGFVADYQPEDRRKTVTLGKPVSHEMLGECLADILSRSGSPRGQAEKKDAQPRLTKTAKQRKILVVDDNRLNQKLAATLLSKRGHLVDVADNGLEALNSLSNTKYDIVLMDIQMPVMDGLTAVRKIRENPAQYGAGLPVVAMTAHALPGDQETFLNAGMTGYVSKPFKPQELIAAAEQLFASGDNPNDNGGKIVAAELDKAAILENFMDDEELLFESIDLFLERVAARMESLKAGVVAQDPDVFMPEAHTLKGMIGIFSTGGAFEAAKKIEIKGREKVTDGIAGDFQALENETEALVAALRDWRSGGA